MLQLDEIPVITPSPVVRELAHPDRPGPRADALLGLRPRFRKDVSEEGFQDRRAAADETGVDFDDAAEDQGRRAGVGESGNLT